LTDQLTLIKKIRSVNADRKQQKTPGKQQQNAIFQTVSLFLALACVRHTAMPSLKITSKKKSLKKGVTLFSVSLRARQWRFDASYIDSKKPAPGDADFSPNAVVRKILRRRQLPFCTRQTQN